jgi:dihydrofolate synthase/folylpolyglutamate synthase
VLDGAHNDASARALAAALDGFLGGRPLCLVAGIYRDKDARAVLRPLLARAARVIATDADARGSPRTLPAERLAAACRRLGAAEVEVCPELPLALARARQAAPGGVVCVTGSLRLVGRARTALGLRPLERLWD